MASPLAQTAVERAGLSAADLERARAIRRRVRLESGRPDGRCGKVAEAIQRDLGWAYRWGHLRLREAGICWIHCWNQRPDGTIVDACAVIEPAADSASVTLGAASPG